jgi:hypothetical protein
MHIFVPWSQFFCLLKPIAHVCTPNMAKDELSAYSASSHGMFRACNKPPFSAFTMLLYLVFRAGSWTWQMESQEFGPWVQASANSSQHPILKKTHHKKELVKWFRCKT